MSIFKTSTVFAENLEQFPNIDTLECIEISQDNQVTARIENADGQRGSLALYYYLFKSMGELDTYAAKRGLELYAEHTADAHANPGKHPNIDRLILIEATRTPMQMRVVYKEGQAAPSNWDDAETNDQKTTD